MHPTILTRAAAMLGALVASTALAQAPASAPAAAPAAPGQAVTVKLANGDVIKATLVGEKPDSVVIKHPVLGELTLPRASVAEVVAVPAPPVDATPKVDLGPAGNAAIDAPKPVDNVNPAADANKVNAAGGAAAAAAPPAPPPPPSPWKFVLDANANYVSAANDQLDFRVAASAVYEQKDVQKWSTSAEYFFKTVDNSQTDNNLLVSTTYDHRFESDPRWLWFGKGQAQYAPLEAFEERLSAWGGIGYEFLKKPPAKLIGKLGAGYSYEFGNINQGYPELYAEVEGDWDITQNQALVGSCWITPDFADFTDYLLLARLEWTMKVPDVAGLKILGGLRWQYQSQVPIGDNNSDFRIYAGLRLEI